MVEVRVNGKTFSLFKQVNVTRSFDEFTGEGRIIVSRQVNNQAFIKLGDLVEIFLDEVPVLTGYAENATDSESSGGHDVSFRLRDKVADIIDSTVPDNCKTLEGVTKFSELCQLVIDGLGIDAKVIDSVGATLDDDLKGGAVGQKAFEFLEEYARKAQSFLNSDGSGNILIQRPSGSLKTLLCSVRDFDGNNIKESSLTIDHAQRYGKIIVRSNGNQATGSAGNSSLNNSGEAVDEDIRSSRFLEIVSSSPMTSDECQRAAEEEVNVRRARGLDYQCKVAGFSANGEIWYPGRLSQVRDSEKGIEGGFRIRECSWEYSERGGETTAIKLTYPDAYTLQATPSASTKKTTDAGITYTVVPGDALYKIARAQGVSLDDLIAANPQIENPDLIFPDQQINIPVSGGDS